MASHQEQFSSAEKLLQLTELYAQTFIFRRDCYPLQLPDGKYCTVYKPLTPNLLIQHIKGDITLGAYALNVNSYANWLCLDADDESNWGELWNTAKQLEKDGLTPYIEPSRRGGHLWLFTPTLSGKDIRRFGLQIVKDHELDVELYPKQSELITGVGSFVRLPLGIHRKSSRRYHFITTKCQPLAPSIRQQMEILSQPKRVPMSYIQHILAKIQPATPPQPKQEAIAMAEGRHLSERIKSSISVQDFVSCYVSLDARGKGLCPFHDDQHQSFQVHVERNFWHCYAGCGSGSIIDFWMKWRETHGQDASFVATITELATLFFG